jgi:hypothetical protein
MSFPTSLGIAMYHQQVAFASMSQTLSNPLSQWPAAVPRASQWIVLTDTNEQLGDMRYQCCI